MMRIPTRSRFGDLMSAIYQFAATKLLGAAMQIVVARLLSLEQYAALNGAQAAANIFGVVQYGGFREFVIQRGRRASWWMPIAIRLSFWTSLAGIAAAIIYTLVVRRPGHVADSLQLPILVLAGGVILIGNVLICPIQLALRFNIAAHIAVLAAFATCIVVSGFSLVHPAGISVALGTCIGAIIRIWLILRVGYRGEKLDILGGKKRLYPYVLSANALLIGAVLLSTVSQSAPILFANATAALTEAAAVAFAMSAASQLLQVVAFWASQVYFPKICNAAPVDADVRSGFGILGRTLLLGFLFFAFVRVFLITLVFGHKWAGAAVNMGPYITGAYLTGALIPAGAYLQAQGRWRHLFILNILVCATTIGLLWIGSRNFNAVRFSKFYSVGCLFTGIYSIAYIKPLRTFGYIAEYLTGALALFLVGQHLWL